MEKIWQTVIDNKKNSIHWPLLVALALVSWIYGIGLWLKNCFQSDVVLIKTPVISVGNITVGGTGKTPVTIFIADYFISRNGRVGIVSSGYGRKRRADIIGSGREISEKDISETGDELMEMAECLPEAMFCAANSKTDAALLLEKRYSPDIIILDDGFQHRKLSRGLDILLFDAGVDLRNESLFPLGRLRERLSAVRRANLFVLTKANYAGSSPDYREWLRKEHTDKPFVSINFINDSIVSKNNRLPVENISGKRCYFFAGIGNNAALRNQADKFSFSIVGYRYFPDH